MFSRIIVLVMDSVGIGAAPDAEKFGDTDAHTLGNIARSLGGLFLPSFEKLGLANIEPIKGLQKFAEPQALFGKMQELSNGKDTTSGHWELAGCPVFSPFPVYPNGFPEELIHQFKKLTGRNILGNIAASGTEIISELGAEHMRTGSPIIYTSADSVFQMAAHEDIIQLEELYELCRITREKVCINEHAVGRVIARPFVGRPGNFTRTPNRHDYSLQPPGRTMLDRLSEAGYETIGVGKIADIYAHRSISQSFTTKSNDHGMSVTLDLVANYKHKGLIMVNLVDFDSLYGHRNDVKGYGQALERLDAQLALLLPALQQDDLLIITADHGCDPTTKGTDHTREFVPLLAYYHGCISRPLGIRQSFADVSATVLDNFGLPPLDFGRSFLGNFAR